MRGFPGRQDLDRYTESSTQGRGGSRTLQKGSSKYNYRAQIFETTLLLEKPRPPNCCDRDQRVADVNRAAKIDLYSLKQVSSCLIFLLKGGDRALSSFHNYVLYVDLAGGGGASAPKAPPCDPPPSKSGLTMQYMYTLFLVT